MEKEKVLKIKGTEVRIESTEDIKEGSFFQDEYDQTFLVVQRIIDRNMESREQYDKNCKIHNIVPFIGKRGSGKTSVMMSFSGILNRYYEERIQEKQYYVFKSPEGKEQKVRFTCIDSIDGSLLEKGEDVFKVILAQMYGKFLDIDRYGRPRERSYEHEKRELQQLFDKVYRSVCKLEQGNCGEPYYEESSISSLKNLANSLALTKEFESLVQQYLKIVADGEKEKKWDYDYVESFLVITVDDLDLNIHKGYEMLEKLHRYMMVPNVIVMLSVDYNQIKLLCEKQLYHMVPNFDAKLNEKRSDVEKVARDFLDKVFPVNGRIYMPALERMNDIQVYEAEGEAKSPKEFLFKLLYEKLGLRMDVAGSKRHYYEQKSLRNFVSFWMMLNNMENVSNYAVFEHNYKILMSDTLNRMADERLDDKHKTIFNSIIATDLLHAARNMYIQVIQNAENVEDLSSISGYNTWKDVAEVRNLKILADNIRFAGYNYGELLRIIYCWGRIDDECKEFVRCLLAYFSLEFYKNFKELQEQRKDKKSGNGEEKRNWIANIINGSVTGSWANRMMPKVQVMRAQPKAIGMVVGLDMNELFQYSFDDIFDFDSKEESLNSQVVLGERLYKKIQRVLLRTMFFSQPISKHGEKNHWNFKEGATTENKKKLEEWEGESKKSVLYGTGIVDFNILGFVVNAFQYEENIKPIIESLCDFVLLEKNAEVKTAVIKKFDKEFQDWKKFSEGFAIPLYDMDVTYNLMKRLRQRNEGKRPVSPNQYWMELTRIYIFVYEKLLENDKWYNRLTKNKKFLYSKSFVECPYIKWIFEEDKGTLRLNDKKILGENPEKDMGTLFEIIYKIGQVSESGRYDEYTSYYD